MQREGRAEIDGGAEKQKQNKTKQKKTESSGQDDGARPPHLVWYELSHSCVLFFRAPQSQFAQKFG
jgi:hypothetical protein